MKLKNMTLNQIRKEGFEALVERLGVTGPILFIRQFDKGKGDYTKERRRFFKDLTLNEIVKEIKKTEKTKS